MTRSGPNHESGDNDPCYRDDDCRFHNVAHVRLASSPAPRDSFFWCSTTRGNARPSEDVASRRRLMEYAVTCIWRHGPQRGSIRQLRRDAFGPLPKMSAPLAPTGDAFESFRFVVAQTLFWQYHAQKTGASYVVETRAALEWWGGD
jgi:hypothetical protein